MFKNTLRSIAAALLFVQGTAAQAQELPITEDFILHELRWEGGARTFISWAPVVYEGEIYVCGAFATRGGSSYRSLSRKVRDRSKVRLGSEILLRNMSFFSDVQSRYIDTGMVGQIANCRATLRKGTLEDLALVSLDIYDGPY